MNHWLIKSEPDAFSIDDLAKVKQEPWNGIRNYQARNFMWRDMKVGDLAIFYHSNAKPPGAVGVARVVSEPYPDATQFDKSDKYYDPKSDPEKPRWWLVDFELVGKFDEMIPLQTMKDDPVLSEMTVCKRGSRLSITPVDPVHFEYLCGLAKFTP
ncbi:MAG: EVE domain-containing protein [Verrucomicrobiales bacterium]|nr:EVE domain-containing protein [Verrucomicrobiota bacterium JB025]